MHWSRRPPPMPTLSPKANRRAMRSSARTSRDSRHERHKWGVAYMTPEFFVEPRVRLSTHPNNVLGGSRKGWLSGTVCSIRGTMADGIDKLEMNVATGGRCTTGAGRRAAALGLLDGRQLLSGIQAVCGPEAAASGGVALASAGREAIGGVQMLAAGSLAGLASVVVVPAFVSDRQQHAVSDPAGGGGEQEPGVTDASAEPSAAERRLGGSARLWSRVGGCNSPKGEDSDT